MSNSKRRVNGVLVLLVTFLLTLLIGCGGGGGGGGFTSTTATTTATTGATTSSTTGTTSGSGNVSFSLAWPTQTRAIPSYAQSIVVTAFVTGTSTIADREAFNRTSPSAYTQQVTINLPVGHYTIKIDARPLPDGQGDNLAEATLLVIVNSGQTLNETISINSLVHSIFIDDLPGEAAVGDSLQLTGHAQDANGNAILLPPNALTWSIVSGGSFATVTPDGMFTVLAPGSVTIQAREVDSGVTTTKTVTLVAGPPNGVIIIVS